MKNNKLMILLIFACFLLLPFKVLAESNGCDSITIELENIELGGKAQDTTHAIGGSHFITPTINITWYESSNGNDYTLMNENSTFDYNIYYKAVLDTSYDELNNGFDEGWELCGLSLDIIDEDEGKIDSKSYNSNSKLEYIFEPFWKYNIKYNMTGVTYEGQSEILEGHSLYVKLTPMNGYRLPLNYEVEYYNKIEVMIAGMVTKSYEYDNGAIKIDADDIIGDISINVEGIPVVKVILDANGGTFKNDIKNINIEDVINFDYETFEKPTRNGYKFIGFYTNDGKSYLDVMNSEEGITEDITFYAKWELLEENPKTFDDIGKSIIMGTISLIGLVGATIYFRKRNKIRA